MVERLQKEQFTLLKAEYLAMRGECETVRIIVPAKYRQVWSEEDIQFLRDHYLEMTDAELAPYVGRDKRSVRYKRRTLNLMKMGELEIKIVHLQGEVGKNLAKIHEILILMRETVKGWNDRLKAAEVEIKELKVELENLKQNGEGKTV